MNKERLIIPDLLKGFAVIFMIQVHILELFSTQDIYESIFGKISLFLGSVPAAPVFMLVMGYLIALRKKEKKQLIFRGIRLFIAGILLNILLNLNLAFHVFYRGWDAFINIYHYLFGVDILHLAGLSLILMGLLQSVLGERPLPWIILALLIPAIGFMIEPLESQSDILNYVFAFIHGKQEWSYFPLVPWFAYPMAGFAFRLIEKRHGEKWQEINIKFFLGAGLFISLLIITPWALQIAVNLSEYYHHGIRFYLWAVGLSALWAIIVSLIPKLKINKKLQGFIAWLGVNVTLVYVIQWIIIGNIATVIFKTQNVLQSLLWFTAIIITTSLLTWLIRKKLVFRI